MMQGDVPFEPGGAAGRAWRAALLAAGLGAIAVLAVLYAVALLPAWWHLAAAVVAGVFLAERALRLVGTRDIREHLRRQWLDLLLLAGAGAGVAAGTAGWGRWTSIAAMYVLVSRTWLLVGPRRRTAFLNVLLAVAAAAAVAALVGEYGFRQPPLRVGVLHAVQTVVVAMFALDRVVRLESAADRRRYFRENWLDFALLAAAVAVVLVGRQFLAKVMSAGALYVIITQAYILISLVLRGVGANLQFASSGLHPTWLLIGSFAVLCLAGSGLLMLPAASPPGQPMYYQDALFTATSATCVTGLVVRDTGRDFTTFGQGVILVLIQLGGLGITMFGTVLALLVGKGMSVRSSDAFGQIIGSEGIGHLARVAKFVVAVTLGLEALGALLLYPMFAAPAGGHVPSPAHAVWDSVFHSISAFCNAGFSLYGANLMQGVREGWSQPLRDHWQVLGVFAPLIVLGGLGFPVLQESARYGWDAAVRWSRRLRAGRLRSPAVPHPRLSLHAKLVLSASALLIVLGAGALMLVGPPVRPPSPERMPITGPGSLMRQDPARWANMPFARRLEAAVFQSVTARTAGFNTIDMRDDLSDAGRLVVCGLMVVGGSPASTAGGMKTVTLAVLLIAAWSVVRRRGETESFARSIPAVILQRAVTVAALYLGLVGLVTLLLCVAMPGWNFMDLLFESCSACGTVGLSAGVTAKLTLMGKLVIIGGMFAGRIGPLTLLLALTSGLRPVRYAYPSENVVLG